jgi:hypothetical protein
MAYDPAKYQIDLNEYSLIITSEQPGHKSNSLHTHAAKHYRGLSGLTIEKANGCTQEDVDGNYI